MTTESPDNSQSSHGVGHIVPIKTLVATGLALLVFTLITVWAAKIDLGDLNIWIALAIAVFKASLVVLFFMHLRYDRPFNGIVFMTSVVFVALFISFALTDTKEYAPDIDAGNAPKVVEALDELQQ